MLAFPSHALPSIASVASASSVASCSSFFSCQQVIVESRCVQLRRAFRALGLKRRDGAKFELDQMTFQAMDVSGDGMLSLDEFEQNMRNFQTQLDSEDQGAHRPRRRLHDPLRLLHVWNALPGSALG